MLATCLNAAALSAAEILKAAEEAEREVKKETVKPVAPGEPTGGSSTPSPLAGCAAANLSGRISLLGVQSDVGPAGGMSPVSRLGRNHPAMKPLLEMTAKMGHSNADTPQAREASQRKSMSDTYETYLYARKRQDAGLASFPIADLMAWVYSGELEAVARAYSAQQELVRQYAPLHAAAEAAGKACP